MMNPEQLTKEQVTKLRSISVVGELVKLLGISSIRHEAPVSLRTQLFELCLEIENCVFITKPPIDERQAIASEFRQRLNAIVADAGNTKSVCEDICVRYDRCKSKGLFSRSRASSNQDKEDIDAILDLSTLKANRRKDKAVTELFDEVFRAQQRRSVAEKEIFRLCEGFATGLIEVETARALLKEQLEIRQIISEDYELRKPVILAHLYFGADVLPASERPFTEVIATDQQGE
jgi:hypothetical protein